MSATAARARKGTSAGFSHSRCTVNQDVTILFLEENGSWVLHRQKIFAAGDREGANFCTVL